MGKGRLTSPPANLTIPTARLHSHLVVGETHGQGRTGSFVGERTMEAFSFATSSALTQLTVHVRMCDIRPATVMSIVLKLV